MRIARAWIEARAQMVRDPARPKARALIAAHPIVAASLVLGLGYMARRIGGSRDPGAGR